MWLWNRATVTLRRDIAALLENSDLENGVLTAVSDKQYEKASDACVAFLENPVVGSLFATLSDIVRMMNQDYIGPGYKPLIDYLKNRE